MFTMDDETREEVARIITEMVKDGLEHPRHLDAGLDAIEAAIQAQIGEPYAYLWNSGMFNGVALNDGDNEEAIKDMADMGWDLTAVYAFPDQVD
jgi:hypothetical protein